MQSRFLHELGGGNWHILMQENPCYLPFLMSVDAPAIYLSLWQATLYIVVEGWRKLALSDETIDRLLLSPNVEALKLHRHGTFHSLWVRYREARFDLVGIGGLGSEAKDIG